MNVFGLEIHNMNVIVFKYFHKIFEITKNQILFQELVQVNRLYDVDLYFLHYFVPQKYLFRKYIVLQRIPYIRYQLQNSRLVTIQSR